MAMSLLATRIPQLQELTTSGHPSKLFVTPLAAFSNLRVLAIRKAIDLPPEFGHVISTLPCLLDLSIILERLPRHWPASDPVIPTQTTCPPGFITLEKLDISGGIAVIDEYLDLISTEASPLRTVSIALFSQSKEALGDPHALYEKVARFETLEEFHIVFKETRRLLSDSAERKITRPALKPLYKLSLLKKFVYEGELSLSDEDVGALVDAWPGLYLLDLHGEVHRQPSYTALSLIAHRCPNLKSLRIPFDFPREIVEITTSEIVDHPLLEFSSYSSVPIHHAAHVARYLDSLFPSLKEVGNWDSGSGWGLVSSIILKACQPVRRDQVIRESRTSFTSAEVCAMINDIFVLKLTLPNLVIVYKSIAFLYVTGTMQVCGKNHGVVRALSGARGATTGFNVNIGREPSGVTAFNFVS